MHPSVPITQPNRDAAGHASQVYWPRWSEVMRRWGLDAPVALLLESAGPLSILLAQCVYWGQPFLRSALTPPQVSALAGLLEDQRAAQAFAAYLREETCA